MEITTPKIIAGLGVLTGLAFVILSSRGSANKSQGGNYIDSPQNAPPIDAKQVAEDLYSYMNQMGTKEDEIFELLTDVSPAQFASIVLAFGQREYNTWTGNSTGLFLTKYPLKFWLKEELSVQDYKDLKEKFPKYL